MLKELLEADQRISEVEILKDEKNDESSGRKIIGKFIKDDLIYSFMNVTSDLVSYLSVRFQFIYTVRNKSPKRGEVLEIINTMNKSFPAVKVFLQDIQSKQVKINFNVEVPYKGIESLETILYPSIDVVSLAPRYFSTKLTEKNIEHKPIS